MARYGLKLLFWLFISFIPLLSVAGCSGFQPDDGQVVKIVTSFPMQRVALGQSIVNSIRLALAEADYRAGDYTIELVVLDDGNADGQWLPDREAENARRAADDPHVIAYIGPLNSGAAKISIPITNRGGLAHISPTNTWPGLTKVGFAPGEPGIFYPTGQRNYFRTAPTDDLQAPAAVKWAENLGFETVFILDDGETYGKGLADLFEAFAFNSRLTVIGHQTIDKTATDFRDVLADIQQQAPNLDLIYFGGYSANGAPLLVRQMKELNMAARFMGPDGIVDSYFIQQAGPAAEGVYATLVGVPPAALTTERGQAFVKAYQTAYGEEPEAFSYLGYDAAQVVLQALNRADNPLQRGAVLDAIGSLGTIEGAAGYFQFDEQGDTTLKVISGNIVRNQTFEFLEILPTR